jgi:predicted nucleic acid-binding protein
VKAVLDACVLYPPVMRDMLAGAAGAGLFRPVWSARIVEEWLRATRKLGPLAEAQARAAAAALVAACPQAMAPPAPALEARLHLPDENDIHVLAVAISSGADAIVTLNAADFPRGVLAGEGIARRDPDGFLWELASHHPDRVQAVAAQVIARAESMGPPVTDARKFFKTARLPRLGKFLEG